MKPKVSVIIPVYNVEKYIQKCIDTLVSQTLQEIELIFIDDNSPDSSIKILEANREIYPNKIKIIRLKENLCQGGARNVGIKAAKADYIGFVDSDDYVSEEMYEKLYKTIILQNCDVVFCRARYVYGNSPEEELSKKVYRKENIEKLNGLTLSDKDRMVLMCNPIGSVWSGLYRKEVILSNNVFFPEHLRYEDNYWCSLIKVYLNKVYFIDDLLYYYRQNRNSTTHTKNQSFQFDRLKTEEMLLDEAHKRGAFYRFYEAFEYMYAVRYTINTIFLIASHFDNPDIAKLDEIKASLKRLFPNWYRNKYLKKTRLNLKIKAVAVKYFSPKIIVLFYKIKQVITGV